MTLKNIEATAAIITDIFEYKLIAKEGNRYRYQTEAIADAAIIDLVELPAENHGLSGGGIIHHVAFRVQNDEILMHFREKILNYGLQITPQIDRNYVHSLYFREPGGVLFELATDNPGFTVDEPLEELGKNLKLPAQYENRRSEIEAHLTPIN